jgi:hypothetical protein
MAVNNKKNNNNSDNLKQENFVLEKTEKDLRAIKGLESIKKEKFKSPEVLKSLNELSSFFINNPNLLDFLQKNIAQEEEIRSAGFIPYDEDLPENLKTLKKIISNLENKLGLDKQDILSVFEAYDEKILLEAKTEVLKSKKIIKIGKKEIPLATLIRIPAYLAGTAAVSLTTAGIAGVAGVALFRNLEKYISDKKDKKNIELKSKGIRSSLDKESLSKNISASLFIKKMEKEENNFKEDFLMNKTEEERVKIITNFVDIKYSTLDPEIKSKIIKKYKAQLEIEKIQTKNEENIKNKLPKIVEKFNKILSKDISSSVESKTIKSILISGAIITTGRIAREIPVIKNILGAYLGWNLGGLADKIINKKEVSSAFDEQDFNEELSNIKISYKEYIKKDYNKNDPDDNSMELFEELLRDLETLEKSKAQAIVEIEKKSLKNLNPEKYLLIKKNIDEVNKYVHLIRARFNAVDLNKQKENILLQNKKDQEIDKFRSSLFRAGGAVLGALTPNILSLITENVHSAPIVEPRVEVQPDDFFSNVKSPNFFQYAEDGGSEPASIDNTDVFSVDNEIVLDNNSDISIENEAGELNMENNIDFVEVDNINSEKINEIVGISQKSVILESGDGISKIFDGNMSGNYKVNFIDEQTGEVLEAPAGSKIVHPGDDVILGEDGKVNVICKQGIINNSKYVDNYLPEENIVPEKMTALKPEEIKIPSEISSDNNLSEISNEINLPKESSVSSVSSDVEEDIVFEKPEYELTRSDDGKLTIEKIADNDISDNDVINDQIIPENTETLTLDESGNVESISDPNALRLDFDENGKLVLKDNNGDIIKESSSEQVIDDNNIEKAENNSFEDNKETVELDESSTEVSSEGLGNVNESFKTPESFKDVLGEDFSNLKIIEKVDNLGNRLGFSLRDLETGKSVDISFPRAGGIRMEEGLNDQAFGDLKENFDEAMTEDRSLIIGTENNGTFSVEDFRSGLKKFLE